MIVLNIQPDRLLALLWQLFVLMTIRLTCMVMMVVVMMMITPHMKMRGCVVLPMISIHPRMRMGNQGQLTGDVPHHRKEKNAATKHGWLPTFHLQSTQDAILRQLLSVHPTELSGILLVSDLLSNSLKFARTMYKTQPASINSFH